MSVEWMIALVVFSIAANGFFAGVETGVTTARRARLVHRARQGDRRAERAARLLESRESSIVGAVVGNNLAVVTGTAIATMVCVRYWPSTGETIAAVAMSGANIVFGEVLPKSLFRAHPENLLSAVGRVFVACLRLLAPVQWVAVLLARAILALFGLGRAQQAGEVDREELMRLVALSRRRAEINAQQGRFLRQLTRNSQLAVVGVMTPLEKVSRVLEGSSVQDARDCVRQTGHSRIPVVDHDASVVGLLLFRDLLQVDPTTSVVELQREVLRLDARMGLDEAIAALIEARVGMAAVLDSEGATLGIVTLEDLFEKLVGDILDEHDRPGSA